MSLSTGEELDSQLDNLNKKIELLAEHLGLYFEYEWGTEVVGIKKMPPKEEE